MNRNVKIIKDASSNNIVVINDILFKENILYMEVEVAG